MDERQAKKKVWAMPHLTVHGKVEEITKANPKYKTFGLGDDVTLCIPDPPTMGSCPASAC